MKPVLSICLPVYNQQSLLEWNLKNLIQCPLPNIEIIVQDNCSSDDIQGLVLSLDDPRLKYYRNPDNIGHDRSILRAFENCQSKHAFLLRTSDTIYPEKIEEIIRFTEDHPQVGYCRFSCNDENGRSRILYPDRIYPKGLESAQAVDEIWIHPSGELYNLSYFTEQDWECLDQYMIREFNHNYRFVVHMMMRAQLSARADLATGSAVVWQYTYTVNRKDKAETGSRDRTCVYAPEYLYDRYRCELKYILKEIDGPQKKVLIEGIIDRYSKNVIFTFKYINRNKAMQNHYSFESIPFSSREEMKKFKIFSAELAEDAAEPYRSQIQKKISAINEGTLFRWHIERTGQIVNTGAKRIHQRLGKSG